MVGTYLLCRTIPKIRLPRFRFHFKVPVCAHFRSFALQTESELFNFDLKQTSSVKRQEEEGEEEDESRQSSLILRHSSICLINFWPSLLRLDACHYNSFVLTTTTFATSSSSSSARWRLAVAFRITCPTRSRIYFHFRHSTLLDFLFSLHF